MTLTKLQDEIIAAWIVPQSVAPDGKVSASAPCEIPLSNVTIADDGSWARIVTTGLPFLVSHDLFQLVIFAAKGGIVDHIKMYCMMSKADINGVTDLIGVAVGDKIIDWGKFTPAKVN